MSDIKVISFTRFFVGDHRPGLQSKIFEEYIDLAKKNKLIIVAQKIQCKTYENLTLIKISLIKFPILRQISLLFGYLFATILYHNEYDIVFARMLNPYYFLCGIF